MNIIFKGIKYNVTPVWFWEIGRGDSFLNCNIVGEFIPKELIINCNHQPAPEGRYLKIINKI